MTAPVLSGALEELAGMPDDSSELDICLLRIVSAAAQSVAHVDYASVTATRDGGYTTVATSSEVALALDEAQYAEDSGPCLDGLEGRPVSVPDFAVTIPWPGFRERALGLGLHASLSIPLFAGSGAVVAVLNMYGREAHAFTALAPQVFALFDPSWTADRVSLDVGSEELLDGLSRAFMARDVIQQALGVIMARRNCDVHEAYVELRVSAAESQSELIDQATAAVVSQTG